MAYSLIKNGIVENVIECDAAFAAHIAPDWDAVVPSQGSAIGWAYSDGVVTPPAAPTPSDVRYLSKLGFRNRFTSDEKARIEFAAIDDPAAPQPSRMLAARLRATLADQRDSAYIDTSRQDTRDGVTALEAVGLLSPGRALVILDTPIQADEMYRG